MIYLIAPNTLIFILYADDTTLSSIIRIPSVSLININNELAKVYDWLAVNKLSLNIGKTKYVIFHAINKRIEGVIPDLEINGTPLDKVKKIQFSRASTKWKYVLETSHRFFE